MHPIDAVEQLVKALPHGRQLYLQETYDLFTLQCACTSESMHWLLGKLGEIGKEDMMSNIFLFYGNEGYFVSILKGFFYRAIVTETEPHCDFTSFRFGQISARLHSSKCPIQMPG